MSEEHSSLIKTPRQLITIVVLAFVVPIILIVMVSQLVTTATVSMEDPAMSAEAVAKRLKPVGDFMFTDPNAPKVLKTGEAIVKEVCGACHIPGALKAPKIGDKAGWAKLIQGGLDSVVKSAIKGKGAMPPRGGGTDLSDTEIARAIVYMVNQSGGSLKEPAALAAPAKAPEAKPGEKTAAAPAADKGKTTYDVYCSTCHAAGIAGAPKLDDKVAWAPRVKAGKEQLYTNAIKGKNAMPPKGGAASLSDADVKASVDYMVGQLK